jgi:hypothetical protein
VLSCKKVAERTSALVYKELSLMKRLKLRMHPAMGKGCRTFIGQIEMTDSLTKAAVTRSTADEGVNGEIKAILVRSDKQTCIQALGHEHTD